MSKPKKEKPTPFRCIEIANEMCQRWSDEALLAKTPEELMRAYGIKDIEAIRILNENIGVRGLSK
jgi:hypothetical protein